LSLTTDIRDLGQLSTRNTVRITLHAESQDERALQQGCFAYQGHDCKERHNITTATTERVVPLTWDWFVPALAQEASDRARNSTSDFQDGTA